MSGHFELKALDRKNLGTSNSRRYRKHEGLVPAVIYGGSEPININLSSNDLLKATKDQAFFSHILTIKTDKKTEKVVVKEIQRHPFKPQILHMDFLRVDNQEPISLKVPLKFVGEAEAVGVKAGGKVAHLINEVEIKCLPKHLPEFIEIDISSLALDASLHLSDLKLAKGVELVHLANKDNVHDLPVVSIHKVKQVETVETDNEVTTEDQQ